MDTQIKTIQEAKELYKKLRAQAINIDLRLLLEDLQKTGFEGEIRNHDYLDALFLTELMFGSTKRTTRILSGTSADGFIEVLKESFEEALKRIRANRGFARIILLSEKFPSLLRQLTDKYKDVLQVTLAKAPENVSHFIACDSRMLRMEDPHEELTPNTPPDAVSARVYFNNKTETKLTEDRFDNIWSYLKGLSN